MCPPFPPAGESTGEVGRRGVEPLKSKDSGFTVRPIWPLWNLPILKTNVKANTQRETC